MREQARLLWSEFLETEAPERASGQRAFALWEGMHLPRILESMPVLEFLEEGLRMSWSSPFLLVQIDVPDDPEEAIEWYAREHKSKRSEAGTGQDSLKNLARWLREVHGE